MSIVEGCGVTSLLWGAFDGGLAVLGLPQGGPTAATQNALGHACAVGCHGSQTVRVVERTCSASFGGSAGEQSYSS